MHIAQSYDTAVMSINTLKLTFCFPVRHDEPKCSAVASSSTETGNVILWMHVELCQGWTRHGK